MHDKRDTACIYCRVCSVRLFLVTVVSLVPFFKRYVGVLAKGMLVWVRFGCDNPVGLGMVVQHYMIDVFGVHDRKRRVDRACHRINTVSPLFVIRIQMTATFAAKVANVAATLENVRWSVFRAAHRPSLQRWKVPELFRFLVSQGAVFFQILFSDHFQRLVLVLFVKSCVSAGLLEWCGIAMYPFSWDEWTYFAHQVNGKASTTLAFATNGAFSASM